MALGVPRGGIWLDVFHLQFLVLFLHTENLGLLSVQFLHQFMEALNQVFFLWISKLSGGLQVHHVLDSVEEQLGVLDFLDAAIEFAVQADNLFLQVLNVLGARIREEVDFVFISLQRWLLVILGLMFGHPRVEGVSLLFLQTSLFKSLVSYTVKT